jgi:hypothetical protein
MSTDHDKAGTKKKPPSRRYGETTLKVIFTLSMNECAYPDCSQPVIQPKTDESDAAVVAQICHIYAASDNGPRGNPDMTDKERNLPDNLMLFCPTHHTIVDKQHETYPAKLLLEWKGRHERRFRETFGASISDLGYEELELTARSLLASDRDPAEGGLTTIPPAAKIAKNGLGNTSTMLLTMGAANSSEVEAVLVKASQLDADFADKLREGFVSRYRRFREDGCAGDGLFMAMYQWAGGANKNRLREAAGLCILAHLFILCDVFEK